MDHRSLPDISLMCNIISVDTTNLTEQEINRHYGFSKMVARCCVYGEITAAEETAIINQVRTSKTPKILMEFYAKALRRYEHFVKHVEYPSVHGSQIPLPAPLPENDEWYYDAKADMWFMEIYRPKG